MLVTWRQHPRNGQVAPQALAGLEARRIEQRRAVAILAPRQPGERALGVVHMQRRLAAVAPDTAQGRMLGKKAVIAGPGRRQPARARQTLGGRDGAPQIALAAPCDQTVALQPRQHIGPDAGDAHGDAPTHREDGQRRQARRGAGGDMAASEKRRQHTIGGAAAVGAGNPGAHARLPGDPATIGNQRRARLCTCGMTLS